MNKSKLAYLKEAFKLNPTVPWKAVDVGERTVLVISELMPMKSNAGWYMGRFCIEFDDTRQMPPFMEPWARETGYYPSKEAVTDAHEGNALIIRDCIENNALYTKGTIPYPEGNQRL